jgi:HD superfamily phosphodiesterase
MNTSDKILARVIDYNGNDARRLNHLLKVVLFARYIAVSEGCKSESLQTIEYAALLHDIGIHESERKHNSSAGNWQEIEGPPIARELLKDLDIPETVKERVCFLVGHHHSYDKIDGLDFQILVEADFLVNIFEDEMEKPAVLKIEEKIFKTKSGTGLLEKLYL